MGAIIEGDRGVVIERIWKTIPIFGLFSNFYIPSVANGILLI